MAKRNEAKVAETRTNKADTNEWQKAAPIKLEFFDGETLAVCDAQTGLCTVPNLGGSTSELGERQKHASDKQTQDGSEPSGK